MTREAIIFKVGGVLAYIAGWEMFNPFKYETFSMFLVSCIVILIIAFCGGATTEMVWEFFIKVISKKKRSHTPNEQQHNKTYS